MIKTDEYEIKYNNRGFPSFVRFESKNTRGEFKADYKYKK